MNGRYHPNRQLICLIVCLTLMFGFQTSDARAWATPNDEAMPNIIFILADDLGYNDVGFNGQKNFETPCLNRMANEGMVFSQFYSGSTVCAPSRACLLTGQHTGHVFQRCNGDIQIREDGQDITVARMLKDRGYTTAMIGKSGLALPFDRRQLAVTQRLRLFLWVSGSSISPSILPACVMEKRPASYLRKQPP